MSILRITKNEKILLTAAVQFAFPNELLSFRWMKEKLGFNRKDESHITKEKEKLNANMLFTPEPSIEFESAKKLLITISLWQMMPLFLEKIDMPDAVFLLDFNKFSNSGSKLPEILFTEKYASETMLVQFSAWAKTENEPWSDRKPLIFSYLQNDPKALEFLIKNGAKSDTFDFESGVAPLHVCVLKQRYKHIPVFKRCGCNMDIKCIGKCKGQTPLYIACGMQDYKAAKLLKEMGATEGLEYLHPEQSFTLAGRACIEGDAKALTNLLHLGALTTTLSENENSLYTPLQLAVIHRHNHLIPILKKYNADMNDGGSCKLTPLTLAIRDGDFETAQILLSNGANINYHNRQKRILPVLAYGTASLGHAKNKEDKVLIISKINFALKNGANPNLHFFEKHHNCFSASFTTLKLPDEYDYLLATLLVNHGFDVSKHDFSPLSPLSLFLSVLNDKKLYQIYGCPSPSQNEKSPSHTPTLFKPENLSTLAVIESIQSNIASAIAKTKEQGLQNIPQWLAKLSQESLLKRSMNDLMLIDNQIAAWKEATIRRLSEPPETSSNTETNDTDLTPPKSEKIIDAIYENTLPFDDQVMIEIRGATNHFLLLPIGSDAQYGIELIAQNHKIDDAIITLFNRVLSDPTLSTTPKQPGIKMLTNRQYTCSVMLNNQAYIKTIVGELKVTDSADRIGLCELTHTNHGPRLLAPICYIEKGLHTDGKNQFHADYEIDLSPENVARIKESIDLSRRARSKSLSP